MLNLQSVPIPKVAQTHRGVPAFQTRRKPIFSTLPTQDDLPSEDNVPMETEPHRLQMELLIDTLRPWLASHGGGYVSGNMFLYFSAAQLRGEDFLGPDVFVVLGASTHTRKSWVVWQEGKGPDLVIELLSEKTAKHDKGKKKQIYQDQLKVAEYFWFDPWNPDDWAGFELVGNQYRDLTTANQTGLPSHQLGLLLVRWQGVHKGEERIWLRWATLDGTVLPTGEELAEAERLARQQAEQQVAAESLARQQAEQRVEAESLARQQAEQRVKAESLARQQAEQQVVAERLAREAEQEARQAVEAELARLKALLAQKS